MADSTIVLVLTAITAAGAFSAAIASFWSIRVATRHNVAQAAHSMELDRRQQERLDRAACRHLADIWHGTEMIAARNRVYNHLPQIDDNDAINSLTALRSLVSWADASFIAHHVCRVQRAVENGELQLEYAIADMPELGWWARELGPMYAGMSDHGRVTNSLSKIESLYPKPGTGRTKKAIKVVAAPSSTSIHQPRGSSVGG